MSNQQVEPGREEAIATDAAALLPPEHLIDFILGAGSATGFEAVGDEYFGFFTGLCGLRPEEHVLEVGSGVGRLALPLTRYLTPEGRFEGLDIVPEGVAWCNEQISSRFPNFGFKVADIYNTRYNLEGSLRAAEYTFPYGDQEFDFVFLASVFTHMLPDGVERYLSEIARVLKPEGRCLITYYLLNDEAFALLEQGKAAVDFPHDHGPYQVHIEADPEETVAYKEEFVRELYPKHGFAIREPIHHGLWAGRDKWLSWQDVIVADREPAS